MLKQFLFYHIQENQCLHFCYLIFPVVLDDKESAWNEGDSSLIPESGRSLGEGNGNPCQYSYLENSMDKGAWWATVHEVAKSRTTANNTHTHKHTHMLLQSHNQLGPSLVYNIKSMLFLHFTNTSVLCYFPSICAAWKEWSEILTQAKVFKVESCTRETPRRPLEGDCLPR